MLRSTLLLSTALIASPAFAEETPAPQGGSAGQSAQDNHAEPSPEIIVTAPYARNRQDVLSGTSVLSGEQLTRSLAPTIGDTLTKLPGVSATSFGPNASRPVLRGFQGDRIRVLTDGIGSIDVSNTSVDHATVINPLTADRIEVLRGPAALLFGSSAIGGVVNVIDSRIPRRMPEAPLHADVIGTLGSAADERAISGATDIPVLSNVVVHFDGSYSKTGDLDTGGYILSKPLRAAAAASAEPDIQDLADLKGKLPNSAARTWDVAGGAAIIGSDGSNVGFSVSHYDSLYGVPVRYSLDPSIEAEEVRLQLRQTRVDLRGEVVTGGGVLDKVRVRVGAADYRHSEIEDTGEVGTTFYNQGYEGRLELIQARHGGWEGAIGGQFFLRDMHVVGEEKFLPKNSTQQFGVFTLQSFDFGSIKAEAGARFEHSDVTAVADPDIGNPAYDRSFNALSLSAGASYAIVPGLRFGINLSRSERAPTAEELFADGPHAGTQAYEIGDPTFKTEKAWGVEATLKGSGDGWSVAASAYHTWFTDYIYDAATGAVEDDLPVYQNYQADARYYGFEAEASKRLATLGSYSINADVLGDYVHAQIVGEGPAPRIPPLRVLGGLEAQSPLLSGRVEVEHVFDQDRVAINETSTDGWTMVNASIAWKPFGTEGTSVALSANNLFDVEARRHASFLKDYAPLAGRDIRLTLRLQI